MFVQQGSTVTPTITSGAATVVYGSTPAQNDLMIVVSQGTSNPNANVGSGFSSIQTLSNSISVFAKLATASETNSYGFGGTTTLTGTGSAFYGAVFRAPGGVQVAPTGGSYFPTGQLATTASSGTVDPAGITDRASVLLISVLRASGASSGTITWNGGSSSTPNTLSGRGGFDFIALSAIPADVKAVWSLGTATGSSIVGFAELQGPGFM